MGLGPGGRDHLTPAAEAALRDAEVVVGYRPYLALVGDLIEGKRTVASGMREEMPRAQAAIDAALGGVAVVVISTGDAGIYGMAGLVLEILPENAPVDVEIVPGITAASAAAACLGAPLMNDFAVVSLSDLMTPLPVIEKRLRAVAEADFVVALYNPRSHRRHELFTKAMSILRAHREAETPAGIVRNALRDGQEVKLTTLGELNEEEIDMLTILIIGNSTTRIRDEWMITPRGYRV
ncbi:MAG: precorrin-3B C(17)-methyltransferase [Armatimonadota bacterium]